MNPSEKQIRIQDETSVINKVIGTDLRKALKYVTLEGAFAAVHIMLTGGAFLTGFALLVGANDFEIGLLGAIPFLAQTAQLISAYIVDHYGNRKAMTMRTLLVARQTWWLLLPLPFLHGGWRPAALLILFAISNITLMMGAAGWTSWVADLVPARIRGRYFGFRSGAVAVATIIAILAGGAILDYFRSINYEGTGFAIIFGIACVFALAALYSMKKMPDSQQLKSGHGITWDRLLDPLRDKRFRHLLMIFFFWNFSLGICAAFFAAHMLTFLKMNFMLVSLYSTVALITTILLNKQWGVIIDRFGCKPVIVFCAFGLSVVPAVWLIPRPDFLWILFFEAIYAGTLWTGFNLAAFNIPIATSPQKNRTIYLAMYAVIPGIGYFLSSLLGGILAENWKDISWQWGHQTIINYHILFIISSVLRFLAAFAAIGFREPGERFDDMVLYMGEQVTKRININWR